MLFQDCVDRRICASAFQIEFERSRSKLAALESMAKHGALFELQYFTHGLRSVLLEIFQVLCCRRQDFDFLSTLTRR